MRMRTAYCGELNISNVGLSVILCGWVNRCRVFSSYVFVEMRDREGIVQVFFDANRDYDIFMTATRLKHESCLQIHGVVCARPVNQINHNMKTGEIEIIATNIDIINSSDPLPLDLNKENSEEQRLKYRYLDLRRSIMFHRLKNRSRVISFIHHFMEEKGFLYIETPILANTTLEGARDYLIPSRLHEGKVYALPQSPQIFKQLLMVSGFDRYYQITKCFRDEDMRSDRQPEFTQIDLETSFMSSEEVREIMESLIRSLWNKILGVELEKFYVLTYREAIDKFSSEHPDLRNPIKIVYFSNISLDQIKHNIFSISNHKKDITTVKVMIMCVPGGAKLSNEEICQYINIFISFGGSNLTWMTYHGFGDDKKIEGSAIHVFNFTLLESILLQISISDKDLVFLSYEISFFSHSAINALRCELGKDLQLIDKESWAPVWIVDFPMFKKNNQGNIVSVHHLFTAPKNFDVTDLLNDPLSAVSNAFDMVINGYEVGSGSARIHCRNMQAAVFKILGFSEDIQRNKFGFLLDALKYGAPIHAGMACGLDRLVMLLSNTNNIRDVIAFPKTTNGFDLMLNTPSIL